MKDNKASAAIITAIIQFILFICPIWYYLSDDMNIGRFIIILTLCFIDILPIIYYLCADE